MTPDTCRVSPLKTFASVFRSCYKVSHVRASVIAGSDDERRLFSVNGLEICLVEMRRAGCRLIPLSASHYGVKSLAALWLGQGCAVRHESYRLRCTGCLPHAGLCTAPHKVA